jgi:hypothetical protein
MEFLIFFEPMAKILLMVSSLTAIGGVVTFVFLQVMRGLEEFDSDTLASIKRIQKKSLWIAGICLALILPAAPLSQPFEIYKKILIIRGIESETADKLVDNIDALLDLTEKKLREGQ